MGTFLLQLLRGVFSLVWGWCGGGGIEAPGAHGKLVPVHIAVERLLGP